MNKLIHLYHQAIDDFYRTLAIDYYYLSERLVFATGIDSLYFNGVLYASDIQNDYEKLRNYFHNLGLPWCVYLYSEQSADQLLNKGFELEDEYPTLYCDLDKYSILLSAVPIKEIAEGDRLVDWIGPIREGFASKDNCERYRVRHVELLNGGQTHLRHFVIYVKNDPACSGTLFLTDKSVMIHNIATKIAYRRRGLARNMLIKLLNIAKESGYKHSFLDSSRDGLALYESLGFREIGTIRCFGCK